MQDSFKLGWEKNNARPPRMRRERAGVAADTGRLFLSLWVPVCVFAPRKKRAALAGGLPRGADAAAVEDD